MSLMILTICQNKIRRNRDKTATERTVQKGLLDYPIDDDSTQDRRQRGKRTGH